MKRLWCLVVPVLFGAGIGQANAADEAVFVAPPSNPVIVTEEMRLQGRNNVQEVVGELNALLLPPDRQEMLRQRRLDSTPDLQIIMGPQPRTTVTESGEEVVLEKQRATLVYQCRYNRAEWMWNALEIILSDGMVEINDEKNQLIINDDADKMDEFRQAILAMDKPSPQVLIEARVIEFIIGDGMQRNVALNYEMRQSGTDGMGEDIPLDSSIGGGTSVLGSNPSNLGAAMDWYPYISSGGNRDLKLTFQWLLTAQDAKLLSAPNIVIARNQEAVITTGQDLPIQSFNSSTSGLTTSTTYKRVGVTLKVEPSLINRDTVTLRVYPEVTNVAQYQRFTQNDTTFQVPVITVRSIDSHLTLEDGQIIMLGGLYDTRESLQQERLPFLSDIPYIGELFTSKSTSKELTQLVFFLRVHILHPDDIDSGMIFDPEEVMQESERIGDIFRNSAIIPKLDTTVEKVTKEFIEEPERNRELKDAAEAAGFED